MMVKEILLTQGKVALVDDEDYERVNQHKWFAHKQQYRIYYAGRCLPRNKCKQKQQSMHIFIMNAPDGVEIDHEDHNGLNNQKYNLRPATRKQNGANLRKQTKVLSSKYKGVYWFKSRKKWLAYIRVDGKRIHLGYFDDETEAALAYDKAALIHFGKFACLNFPPA